MNDARLNDARQQLTAELKNPTIHATGGDVELSDELIDRMLDAHAAAVANVVSDSEAAAARGIIAEVKAERDQARRIAVDLENENARLTDELANARAREGRLWDGGDLWCGRARKAEAQIARLRQMADTWEKDLPNRIHTAAAADAIRAAIEETS